MKFCDECKKEKPDDEIIQPDGEEDSYIGICKECADKCYNPEQYD